MLTNNLATTAAVAATTTFSQPVKAGASIRSRLTLVALSLALFMSLGLALLLPGGAGLARAGGSGDGDLSLLGLQQPDGPVTSAWPPAPQGLRVVPTLKMGEINLAWAANPAKINLVVERYTYTASGRPSQWQGVVQLAASTTSFTDQGLQRDWRYAYRVRNVGAVNYSAVVTTKTRAGAGLSSLNVRPALPNDQTAALLTWGNPNGEAVRVEISTDGGRSFRVQAELPKGATSYTQRGMPKGHTVYFKVRENLAGATYSNTVRYTAS